MTYGLKVNDIEGATAAKFALEQRQREEAAQRKEAGVKWDTKLFHQIGENWFFNEPLPKRIRDHKLPTWKIDEDSFWRKKTNKLCHKMSQIYDF